MQLMRALNSISDSKKKREKKEEERKKENVSGIV